MIANETIQPVDSVHDLGVNLDFELNMQAHVTKKTQACFFQLRRLWQIRCLLGRDVTASLVSTLILWWLDYSNALQPAGGITTVHYGAVTTSHERCRATRLQPPVTGPCHTSIEEAALVADSSSSAV